MATAVNGTGVRHLARPRGSGAPLPHVSTDYVFPGHARKSYLEDAPTSPVNTYGRGKLAGDRVVVELLLRTSYIVRTAWLYGAHGHNFVTTMLQLAARRKTLGAVADQHDQPTWSRALAGQLSALGPRAPAGVHHGTAAGRTTWYGLAREAFRLSGLDTERIRPVGSVAFPRPAARPALGYSVTAAGRVPGSRPSRGGRTS
ncbi:MULTISPECIES: SDR family oxidoreductase [unclassified Streptomyces]|uniref:SDR family oxidoreductase n=1 Tax=unclassified Streptomyces TaxID=2593676 RepID=UPI002E0D6AA7|nr:NAD(P)-dependent oxidoreductase [Streptomyces sp. NBC_01744]WSJ49695.1 NAD(P)-dependent oxidoreductase [Streptomyces sp. NBC_01318]